MSYHKTGGVDDTCLSLTMGCNDVIPAPLTLLQNPSYSSTETPSFFPRGGKSVEDQLSSDTVGIVLNVAEPITGSIIGLEAVRVHKDFYTINVFTRPTEHMLRSLRVVHPRGIADMDGLVAISLSKALLEGMPTPWCIMQ